MKAGLLPLIEHLAMNRMLNVKAPFMRKNKSGLGLIALSGFLFFVSLIFAILSAHGALLIYYTEPLASLIMAAGILVLCAASGAGGWFLLRKTRTSLIHDNDVMHLISEIADIVGDELAEPIHDNPKTAALLAALAGFIASEHLH